MFTFKLKGHYSRAEIAALTDMLLSIRDEIYEAGKCAYERRDCRKCQYKHLCKDVENAVHHLKTR